MNQQIHLFYIPIIALLKISTSIIIHHHRIFTVFTRFPNQGLHIVFELIIDSLLIGSPMYSLITQRKSEDNILAAVIQQIIVTSQQIQCTVSTNRNTRCIPWQTGLLILETLVLQFSEHIGITMITVCPLSVSDRRSHYRNLKRIYTFFTTINIESETTEI